VRIDDLTDAELREINSRYGWTTGTLDSNGRVLGNHHLYLIPDSKVILADKHFSLNGKTVVEFGALEGAQTVSLCRLAWRVIALESRSENIEKIRVRCGLYGAAPEILKMNVEVETPPAADVFFHCGVLYHLEDPAAHLIAISSLTSHLFLDTHYAAATESEYVSPADRRSYRFWNYREAPGHSWSGMSQFSRWLALEDIVGILKRSFRRVEVVRNEMENYVRATVVAEK
jgi:hypothetical protein